MNIFGWLEKEGTKVLHVVEAVPSAAATVEKLLVDGQKIEPAIKAGITVLVKDAEAVALAGGPALLAKGINPVFDMATAAAAEQLVKDFIAFLPTLEKAGAALIGDVKAGIATLPQGMTAAPTAVPK